MSRATLSLLLLFVGALGAPHSLAAPPHVLRTLLAREIGLIDKVSPFVERMDLAALLVLKTTAADALESLKTNGPTHMRSIQGLQDLVIQYRFSKSLFEQIRTEHTADRLLELRNTAERIAEITGFDETPYTRITRSVFSRVHLLVRAILDLPVTPGFRSELTTLLPPLGRLLSIASEGDHAETLNAAATVQASLESLYPAFDRISIGHAAFNHVLEIQGLNEFYTRFSATESIHSHGTAGGSLRRAL